MSGRRGKIDRLQTQRDELRIENYALRKELEGGQKVNIPDVIRARAESSLEEAYLYGRRAGLNEAASRIEAIGRAVPSTVTKQWLLDACARTAIELDEMAKVGESE